MAAWFFGPNGGSSVYQSDGPLSIQISPPSWFRSVVNGRAFDDEKKNKLKLGKNKQLRNSNSKLYFTVELKLINFLCGFEAY